MNFRHDEISRRYVTEKYLALLESSLLADGLAGKIYTVDEIFAEHPVSAMVLNFAAMILEKDIELRNIDVNIYICFVEREDIINARASRIAEKDYVITFFSGAFNEWLLLSTSISNCEGISEIIGEKTEFTINDDNFLELGKFGKFPTLPFQIYKTASPLPIFYGIVGIIMLHEIAHITNGHLRFIRYMKNNSSINGIDIYLEDKSKTLTMHTLEYDADASSVVGWFSIVAAMKNYEINSFFPKFFLRFLDGPLGLAEYLILCCWAVALYESWAQSFSASDSSHAPTFVRTYSAILTILTVLRVRTDVSEEAARKSVKRLSRICLNCSRWVRGSDVDNYERDVAEFSKNYQAYSAQIKARWGLIRDKLQDLKCMSSNLAPA